ncbi:recombinase family protein [Heliorestis convoluta]|uniref:Recombinase family protein n=1 Tax=Heliorestis convoluta TaxID=356322 RepID=A0A5Q2N4U1_9FIRM|nr:recombinase family protein [Heliorestis convoluta]QGG48953.1 recombinase family protein [Heliorestis convoluta]
MYTAIYARVSTEDQAKHGYSLAHQIAECRQKAGTVKTKEYIDDGVSGEVLVRPALSRLLADVRAGIIDRVVFYSADRLSRNLENQLAIMSELKKKKVQAVFVRGDYQDTPEGAFMFKLHGAVAELEKNLIAMRTADGRRSKAKNGKIVKNYHIFGYDYDTEKGQLVVNETEAEVVRMIFHMFTKENHGINGIAKHLDSIGVKTKKGGHSWHRQVVRQILMNPVYDGKFTQNRWNTEKIHLNKYVKNEEDKVRIKERSKEEWIIVPCPRIVDDVTFSHAQSLLTESRRRWAGKPKNEYLLSGLVRCGECGNTMSGRKAKNWDSYVFEYYDVKSTAGAKNKGCGLKIRCEQLDNFVWRAFREMLDDVEGLDFGNNESFDKLRVEQNQLEKLQKELEKVKKGQVKLTLSFAVENVGDDIYQEAVRELQNKEKTIIAQIETIQSRMEELSQTENTKDLLLEAKEYYMSHEDELDLKMKQNLIRFVVREIRVFKDEKVDILLF